MEISSSRQFLEWLVPQRISLAVSTYQTGKIIFLGTNESGQLSAFQRLFNRAMGLYATTERLYLSCKYQLWQLDNALLPGQIHKGYDKLYVPRIGHTTGDIDIHDVAIYEDGKVIFVSTLLNCLATLSDSHSCKPLWKPPFISRIAGEDRCHLNGLAMVDGKPGYVTACSRSDIVDGWRDRKVGGGVVIDVSSNEIICTGLTMPHSPRWYKGKLWLHNSGRGELGYVDLNTGKFEAVAFCPGYLRGLAFWEDYAIVGLSKPRGGDGTFSGLPLDDLLREKDGEARCGLMVVDLNTGTIAHWVRFEGQITELYDVQVIPGVKRPMALGFQTEEISQLITLESNEVVSENQPLNKDSNIEKKKYQNQKVILSQSLLQEQVTQDKKKLLVISKHDDGGFFSNLNKVVQLLGIYSKNKNYDYQVDWTFNGDEDSFRYSDVVGENAWNFFFEDLPFDENYQYSEKVVQNQYLNYSITHVYAHDLYLNKNFSEIRRQYHHIYQQYIKIKPDILAEVDNFFATHMAGGLCLGVHKRHWLHQIEDFSKTAVSVSDYIKVIQELLSQSGAETIFLATDEEEAVVEIKKAFGNRVICRSDISRASVDDSQEMHRQAKNSGSRLGREVLIDALLLSKCDLMLHGVSNISTAISFINPHLEMVYLYVDKQGQTRLFSPIQNQENLSLELNDKSNYHQILLNRSRIFKKGGNLKRAEACLRKAIGLKPDYWAAYNNLGTLLQNQENIVEAKQCYEKAIKLNPHIAEAISNLASIWQVEEDFERAKTGFYRALQLKPDYIPAHLNLARIFKKQQRLLAAIDHFENVIALDANHKEGYLGLATIYEYQNKLEEALYCYEQVEKLEPDAEYIKAFITNIKFKQCNWKDYNHRVEKLINLVETNLANPYSHFLNPFALTALPLSLQQHQAVAKNAASEISLQAAKFKQHLQFKFSKNQPEKLRIGYISPDFRSKHPVGRLIHKMFQHHNRSQFEIYVYHTVDVDDDITQEVRSGCDVFVDISCLSSEEKAKRIYADGIHILIDLAGYTIGNAEILALQPAPIQAQWLGYPNTMGADFVQYYLGDRTLITPEIANHYTEEIIYLPHAFVASPLPISDKPMTRAEFGLPEDAFVFCCFNAHYKITPELFDIWMRILEQVPNSVLWLASGSGMENLRLEAKKHGCDTQRLIFAEKVPHDEYLARYRLADLYLDTFIYNAGSTAAAVLQSGLPLLTRCGDTNASRMGASICTAAGLESTICNTVTEYEQKAVYLATHSSELSQIRFSLQEKLQCQTTYPPLFRVREFVLTLESAFIQMWQKFVANK